MDEKRLQKIQILKLLTVVVCALLYAYGGMDHKWLRRFLAPSIAGGVCFAVSRDWMTLIKTTLLILSSVMGYGAESTAIKVLKRLKVGFSFALAACCPEAIRKKWPLVILSFTVIPSAFVLLGVFNPTSARVEETLLGLLIYSLAIMPVEKREG